MSPWLFSYSMLWAVLAGNAALAGTIGGALLRERHRWDFGPDAEPSEADRQLLNAELSTAPRPQPRGMAVRQRHGRPVRRAFRRIPAPDRPSVVDTPVRYQRLGSVSVVIPTADSPELLSQCLGSLREAQGSLRLQVLCVFSEEPARSREICARFGAEVLRAPGSFVFARSANLGFRAATEPLVLLLNNDVTWGEHGDLERLVRNLEMHPHLAAVGPVSNDAGVGLQVRGEADPEGGLIDPNYALIGFCILFRREMLESVGPFDEAFHAYGYDEVDWFWRARAMGYRWAVDERIWALHWGRASFPENESLSGLPVNLRHFRTKWGSNPDAPGAWFHEQPTVSLVLCSRGPVASLRRTLSSIHEADLPDCEIIVALAGKDGERDLRASSLCEGRNVRLACFSETETDALLRNRALRMARGRTVAFMDADEPLPPNRIRFLLWRLDATGASVVYGDTEIGTALEPAEAWDPALYAALPDDRISLSAALFRREMVEADLFFDETLPTGEEKEWLLFAASAGYDVLPVSGAVCRMLPAGHQPLPLSDNLCRLLEGRYLSDEAPPAVSEVDLLPKPDPELDAVLEARLAAGIAAALQDPGSTIEDAASTAPTLPLPKPPARGSVVPAAPGTGASIEVLIPTSDRPDLLANCLRALRQAQGRTRLKVRCLFSETPRRSQDICRYYSAETVRIRGRFCFARTVNAGLRDVTEPLVLLLNNDAYFQRFGDLERLASALLANPSLGAIGPVSNNIGSTYQERAAADPDGGLIDPLYTLIGHCVLFRREWIEAIGPWDERFRGYGYDEVDWFWRARLLGFQWAVDERTWVEHAGSATFTHETVRRRIDRNRELFMRKWGVVPEEHAEWTVRRPKVSVVISSYNGAPWLDACFRSIEEAGLADYEVVFADDASTDSTSSILARWTRRLPMRCARFRKANNAAMAKNRAMRMATGDYIALMDADDEMPAPRIPHLLRRIEESGADLVYGPYQVIFEVQSEGKRVHPREWDLDEYASGRENWIHPCATLFRRALLDEGRFFDETLPAFEDFDWILGLARRGYRLQSAPGPNCHLYYRRTGSVTHRYDRAVIHQRISEKHANQE